jgi:hypothetical protein
MLLLPVALVVGAIRAQATANSVYAELERIQDDRTALHTNIAPPWVSAPNMRGTADILWSCLLTLFACIYTALHLNVPPRGAGAIHVLLSKCRWGLAALFAPEIVLFYASTQFFEARELVRYLRTQEARQQARNQESTSKAAGAEAATGSATPELIEAAGSHEVQSAGPNEANSGIHKEPRIATTAASPVQRTDYIDKCEFDLKYGFFVAMGGVEITHPSENSDDIRTLSIKGVKELAKQNIDAVKVSRSSIDDRSKADLLQKGLVLLQVTWMAVQCIARKAYGLPITLLELHTMVHVVCAFSMYAFWLKKPLDVKSAEVLDKSKFGQVELHDVHFQQRGANIPGVSTSQILDGDVTAIVIPIGHDTLPAADYVFFTSLLFLPLIYGGVHLSAWNFEFPTTVEGLLWKISGFVIATLLFVFTILSVSLAVASDVFQWGENVDTVIDYIAEAVLGRVVIYAIAVCRIYIVVEAFISLRAAPIGVYWTPAWIQMIPHV